jgi:AcrR family transcriptional regulator
MLHIIDPLRCRVIKEVIYDQSHTERSCRRSRRRPGSSNGRRGSLLQDQLRSEVMKTRAGRGERSGAAPKQVRAISVAQPAARKHQTGAVRQATALTPAKGARRRLRGVRTRRRIMDATLALLTEQRYANVRITDIARAAHIAQPNFYAYFSSVEDVVFAIAEGITVDELSAFVEPDWHGEHGLSLARGLVQASLKLFQRHHTILALVGFLADKQPGRFSALRVRLARKLYKGFESKIRQAQLAGRLSTALQPRFVGYQCVGILIMSSQQYDLWMSSGFPHRDLVETTARFLLRAVGEDAN